jgi:hypothetical protein
MRCVHHFALMFSTILCAAVTAGQELPAIVHLRDLSKAPEKFDGRLIQVRAWLAFGWEGDNYLFDSSDPAPLKMPSHPFASVWFYCKPDHEREVWSTVKFGGRPVLGTFTGYFHFVPDRKARVKDMFDPGPLQLEVIRVADLGPTAKAQYSQFSGFRQLNPSLFPGSDQPKFQ